MLIDVHTHLDDTIFDNDREEVIERAKQNGILKIINCGLHPESNRKTLALAKQYSLIEPALGIYPSYAATLSSSLITEELEFIQKKKITAISEVGLDATYGEMKKQKEVFEKFIALAEKKKIPLIVHSRKAEQEVIDALQSSNTKKIVMHCFTGNKKQILQIEEQGWFFSIPPVITRSHHFQSLVDKVTMSQLLTESDSPYLSPYLNQRNEPSFIKETIKVIAQRKNLEITETEKILFMNFKKLFQ